MANTITSFTAGDIVVSISGNGDGSGPYTDNQATPITLEELTPSGTIVGQMVLPQTTTGNESVISGEYGSSSEGSLELSADGQSLTIAGYGVNAATYNAGESNGNNAYGNAALAQTTSVQGGSSIAVPRVVADIRYDGTTDTSTSLYNIYNTQNPRSVVTADGSSFYLSGQGVKGSTNQGVFQANDGSSTYSTIYTGTDTRTAELYNGTLYVSADSSINKGTGNISSFGMSPTGATSPTPLPGITGKVTLAAGQGNSINGSSGTVDLSPENFYFANSSTLYIADSGNPKGGTPGDGGLQKWSLVGGTWKLDYTVSAGLNLVVNTTADPGPGGTTGTTGLIGLTGKTNADGTVSLYATNATVGDLNQTYLYGLTDTVANMTAPAANVESFQTLATAAPDTNIRGVAFAPQAVCFASGTRIATARGDIVVEALAVGDRVVTASGALRDIVWLGHRTIDCRHRGDRGDRAAILPIRIAAHAFAENRPSRDLFVSPGHAICVDAAGEVLIPAGALINGTTITQVEVDSVTYWHVELATHDIILAENLAAESYLEMGNRGFFAEAACVSLQAAPDAPVRTHADFCRPFHVGGPVVAAVRARLDARAAMLAEWVGRQALRA